MGRECVEVELFTVQERWEVGDLFQHVAVERLFTVLVEGCPKVSIFVALCAEHLEMFAAPPTQVVTRADVEMSAGCVPDGVDTWFDWEF
jgi:hypothetical protein